MLHSPRPSDPLRGPLTHNRIKARDGNKQVELSNALEILASIAKANEGAAVPDVSTPEALKQLLINAKTIAYPDQKFGGRSVMQLMEIADRFGIIHTTA